MNYQAILATEREYKGEPFTENTIGKYLGWHKIKDKENTYDYYDQYNKPSMIRDGDGNIVGYIMW